MNDDLIAEFERRAKVFDGYSSWPVKNIRKFRLATEQLASNYYSIVNAPSCSDLAKKSPRGAYLSPSKVEEKRRALKNKWDAAGWQLRRHVKDVVWQTLFVDPRACLTAEKCEQISDVVMEALSEALASEYKPGYKPNWLHEQIGMAAYTVFSKHCKSPVVIPDYKKCFEAYLSDLLYVTGVDTISAPMLAKLVLSGRSEEGLFKHIELKAGTEVVES